MTESSPSAYDAPVQQSGPEAPLNVLGIVGFVLSLLGFNIIAVVLGHIALSQIKRTGERGRGFAIAALVIGYASIALIVLLVGFSLLAVLLGAASSTNY